MGNTFGFIRGNSTGDVWLVRFDDGGTTETRTANAAR